MAVICCIAAGQTYRVTDLGTLGGDFAQVTGINDTGQVSGYSGTPNDAAIHAFFYNGRALIDCGTLGGTNSFAQGIGGRGQVVGGADYQFVQHAFEYFLGSMRDLGTLGGSFSQAYGVNSNGTIVGVANTSGDQSQHAFAYYSNAMHDLGTLGGSFSQAFGVNESGAIAGESETSDQAGEHAFLYSGGVMNDLGTLGGSNSYGYAINASNQVVGVSYLADDATQRAFLYSGGAMTDLGTLGGSASYANGIDDAGDVVGQAYLADEATLHAFVYHGGAMVDLNAMLDSSGSGMTIANAVEINSHGVIAADAITSQGDNHAVVLTPYFVADPSVYSIASGQFVSGALANLFDRDSQYLIVRSGPSFSDGSPPLSVVLTGYSQLASPTDVRMVVVGHAQSVDIGQTIELYDYVAGNWVLVDSRAAGVNDLVATAVGSSPARFVQFGTNQMMTRVSWKPFGPLSASPWTVSIDQAVWNVSP